MVGSSRAVAMLSPFYRGGSRPRLRDSFEFIDGALAGLLESFWIRILMPDDLDHACPPLAAKHELARTSGSLQVS
jgi:hypothetical protein